METVTIITITIMVMLEVMEVTKEVTRILQMPLLQ
jgi:hypothetical protein